MQTVTNISESQISVPSYYDGEYHNPHKGDGVLYHFTTFNSFKEILKSMTLKTSSFEHLNDMNEANINNLNLNPNILVMCKAKKLITEQARLLCFSQSYGGENGELKGEDGTNHPAMWSHYSEDSRGVCMAIDKAQFIEQNKEILNSHKYWFQDVIYDRFNISQISNNTKEKTPEEFIMNHWEDLFFRKYIDWEHEDEHRLCIMNYDGVFNINGCIKYIVIGRRLFLGNEQNHSIKEIVELIINPQYKCFQKFIPHSFASFTYSPSGYETFECAFKIIEILEQNQSNSLFRDYCEWLIKNFHYIRPLRVSN